MTTSVLNHINIDKATFIERAIKKWKPILETVKIDESYWSEIALFCESHNEEDNTVYIDANKITQMNKFAITIKILSQLDLSKVMFTDVIEICNPIQIAVGMSAEAVQDIRAATGLDVILHLESKMIEEMTNYLKKKIEEDGGVVFGGIVDISQIITDIGFTPKLIIRGYVLPYNVYRYKKLMKVKSLINERKSRN